MEHHGGGFALLSRILTVAETGSTNADMIDLARAGAEDALWLRAGRQTGGRGRQGRVWQSPVGNLYASTLVRLHPSDPPAATLALVAAVAVWEVCGAFLNQSPSPFRRLRASLPLPLGEGRGPPRSGGKGEGDRFLLIKWPNDLLLDGAKLAGILLERAEDAVVIGIGANLAHHPDLPDRPATSLSASGVAVAPDDFLTTLAETLTRWLQRWRGEGLDPVRRAWLSAAHPVGTALTARLPDGTALDGLFEGLNRDGALLLRLADGAVRTIHAGDVFLV